MRGFKEEERSVLVSVTLMKGITGLFYFIYFIYYFATHNELQAE